MDRQHDTFSGTVDREFRDSGTFQSSFDVGADQVILFELLREILIVIPTRIPWARDSKSESYRVSFLSQGT